jgi:hypothetical protein
VARWKLIELDWPRFEPAAAPHRFTLEDFQVRIAALRNQAEKRALTHLVVYGDREHYSNLAYLTNLDPRFEEALLILGLDGKPLLLTGNECEGYLPISPLWEAGQMRHERYQPFSLLDQPRDSSRALAAILQDEGIGPGTRVGAVGWKYYGDAHAMDLPSYIVDALRSLAGYEAVVDATDLLMSPAHGLRAQCSGSEIAFFEYTNYKASEAMKRMHFALRLGMTDHELVSEARYDGLPLACHITLKTGPDRIGLSSPSGDVVERGYPLSANISYWGSNVCRAGWVAESAADFPEPAADYVEAFAGPYFVAMAEWLNALRIGEAGGTLYSMIQRLLPFDKYGVFLNPGHLIHFDEWLSSPIYANSQLRIRSGMVMQSDVIPSSAAYFSTRMEDGFAIADDALRAEIRAGYPDCHVRIDQRREFIQTVLGIALPDEVLPLSNMACLVPPFLLRPNLVFAL